MRHLKLQEIMRVGVLRMLYSFALVAVEGLYHKSK